MFIPKYIDLYALYHNTNDVTNYDESYLRNFCRKSTRVQSNFGQDLGSPVPVIDPLSIHWFYLFFFAANGHLFN